MGLIPIVVEKTARVGGAYDTYSRHITDRRTFNA